MQFTMLTRNLGAALAVLLLMAGVTAKAQMSERLSVSSVGDNYLLVVPVSRLELLMPKGGLVQMPARVGGSTESPRYFQFDDPVRGLIVSGWFESSSGYRGMDRYWEQQLAAWKNRGLPTPSDGRVSLVGDQILTERELTGFLSGSAIFLSIGFPVLLSAARMNGGYDASPDEA